jgi:hypothetical protein
MGEARDKLNVLYFVYCVGAGSLIGFVFDSSTVSVFAIIVLFAISINERFLR